MDKAAILARVQVVHLRFLCQIEKRATNQNRIASTSLFIRLLSSSYTSPLALGFLRQAGHILLSLVNQSAL